MGRQVHLVRTPKRIISLVPSQTELLFDLGLSDEIVGITKFCVHPEVQFRIKPRVGGTKKVNFDRVAELKPDLIIANKEENDREQIETLMNKYPVWISDVKHLEDALDMIRILGKLVGKTETADHLAQTIQQAFFKVSQANLSPLKAAYFIWNEPMMVAGGDTFIDQMLKLAGYQNVFGGIPRYPGIDIEDIQAASPQVILLSSEPFPFKEKHLTQFKQWLPNSVVHLVDGELFSWYGSRLLKSPSYFMNLRKTIDQQLIENN